MDSSQPRASVSLAAGDALLIADVQHDFLQQRGLKINALAAFADCAGGARLGADRAGALGRPAEAIGRHVSQQLLADVGAGAALDRFAADQIIPFAALASGESRFSVPMITDHMASGAWLARVFLDTDVKMTERRLSIPGVGFSSSSESPTQGHA
jgi:RNA 3'-terminal phosphate cyclase